MLLAPRVGPVRQVQERENLTSENRVGIQRDLRSSRMRSGRAGASRGSTAGGCGVARDSPQYMRIQASSRATMAS